MKSEEYKLIPMDEIDEEAKKIAVLWHENATGWIGDKHKLASDIMNYAAAKNKELTQQRDELLEKLLEASGTIRSEAKYSELSKQRDELLEALEEAEVILASISSTWEREPIGIKIKTAIAKAKGDGA